ncbi:MAG TPA: hypothetical protein PKL73_04835 [Polyangiaceae bacterium]|nr:MAG: Dihydroorotate dehydrogenase B (NAD(+)), electron transfer subunit [Deltaproteobacteria bacterium ADurb.Bin207]HNS96256.1 hypothetical protein [Polyangiaceae bacterium]HNZ20800.1 hypothetical protein [Polyangiaceae bacterium]HOD22668.1 hypothetical protein [Polyangiaceae bacterium]HOE48230.1 hypothetical protein [Polyangiaceae bacterium]
MEQYDRRPARQVTVPLVRRDSIGASHHVLTFEYDTPLEAQAGQFVMVRGTNWGQSPFLPRPMSLLHGGKRPSILVKVVGEGTRRLANAEPGDLFSVLAPLGRPWSPCSSHRVPILVAGGVGVCPLLFLARTLKQQGIRPVALYGGRSSGDLVLYEELQAESDLRLATEDGSAGVKGKVTALLDEALMEADGRATVYTCGPRAMMASVVAAARKANVPCEVSLETVMACGYGVCLGCAVPRFDGGYVYACSEGACIDGRVIDWKK